MRVATVVCALVVAGCAGASGTAPAASDDPADRVNGVWRLTFASVGGREVPGAAGITLGIVGGGIQGTARCNSYGGRVSVGQGRWRVHRPGATTEVFCEDQAVENAYFRALGATTSARRAGPDRLVLAGDGVRLRFTALDPVALAQWWDSREGGTYAVSADCRAGRTTHRPLTRC